MGVKSLLEDGSLLIVAVLQVSSRADDLKEDLQVNDGVKKYVCVMRIVENIDYGFCPWKSGLSVIGAASVSLKVIGIKRRLGR